MQPKDAKLPVKQYWPSAMIIYSSSTYSIINLSCRSSNLEVLSIYGLHALTVNIDHKIEYFQQVIFMC